jgi:hypothetical protein
MRASKLSREFEAVQRESTQVAAELHKALSASWWNHLPPIREASKSLPPPLGADRAGQTDALVMLRIGAT